MLQRVLNRFSARMEVIALSDNKWLFSYDKAIVLNALYDAIDRLSFVIDSSNSVRGMLLVSSKTFPELRGRIAISPYLSETQTLIEVFTDHGDENRPEWVDALMDEAQALIRKAKMRVSN